VVPLMGAPVPISLGLRANPSRFSGQAGAARLINCFAEEIGEEGKSQWAISATAGLSTFGSALDADGGIRDMLEVDGYLYVVAGRQAFRVDASGVSTTLGGFPTDGPVYMRRNRRVPTQIGIVSDGLYYVIDSGTLSEVSDSDLPPPSSLAYLDGYGILPISRGRYMLTGIDDFTTVDSLDESVAEANPDPILRAHELEREVYFFGTKSIEAHQNTGDADFPLTRSQAIEVGCGAADSVCAVDTPSGKSLMFVANDHTVRVLRGYTPAVVSTGEIENKIRQLAEAGSIDTLRATAWSWGGRFFYALSCASWTRCYDAKTGLWHERASYLSDRWRVSKVVPFGGVLVAGDATTGQLYTMNDDTYVEGSEALVLQVVTPPIHAFPYGGAMNALYVDAVSGVGLNTTTTHNLDPVLMVDWSLDGGATFSTPRETPLHRQGQTGRRVRPLFKLGRFGQKGVAFRFRISASVQKVLLSASLDFDRLAA
jgi:hypothetical protein